VDEASAAFAASAGLSAFVALAAPIDKAELLLLELCLLLASCCYMDCRATCISSI
jgi:hypothetical protein